tara:strand:+ start:988 stop:1344 length:357 start_codon:yes stop_codon:yes gene_type:complete
MKRILVFLLITSVLSCKNSSPEGLTTIKGNYIYFEDAAVLQNENEIYGVFLNAKALELNEKAASFKTSSTDVIAVEITGIITTKKDPKILWENKLEIINIIAVSASKEKDNTLKLGTE